MRRLLRIILWLFVAAIALVIGVDSYIAGTVSPYLYPSLQQVPSHQVALVLGTSKYVGKRLNKFYVHRITAIEQLYRAGKLDAVLISGDNRTRYYNEPITMANDLIKAGLPEEMLTLDYAGLRTLDSVIRANKVFGLKKVLVVSQQFHTERAIYIAREVGIDAWGYVAQDAPNPWFWRVRFRELFARVKAWLDVNLLLAQPKHLGEPVEINRLSESANSSD